MSFLLRNTLRRAVAVPRRLCFSTSRMAPLMSLPEFSLKDRVVIITGGVGGLGLTQAEAIIESGGRVYALDVLAQPSSNFERVASRTERGQRKQLEYMQADVRDRDALHRIVEHIVQKEKRIDGLIATAGISGATNALDYAQKDVERILEINTTGVFMSAQAVAKQMVKLGTAGSMVLIASVSGSIANQGVTSSAYNASKAAVVQLGRNLAMEWGQYGIRVNTLSPGYILTDMVERFFATSPELRELYPSHNIMKRLSDPREFRGAAVFLLSDASSFMTGSDLLIDGGHSAW